jgi:hypothetical protein
MHRRIYLFKFIFILIFASVVVAGEGDAAKFPDWQARRAQATKILLALKTNPSDKTAAKELNAVLNDFEKNPTERTPLEILDLLGTFYLPKEGIEKGMIIVTEQVTLGWYDSLRWATKSGKAEILNTERLFTNALQIAGKKVTNDWLAIVKNKPEKAKEIVEKGIAMADRVRNLQPGYDHQWPTAYGTDHSSTPKQNLTDAEAWPLAVKKVTDFYLFHKK